MKIFYKQNPGNVLPMTEDLCSLDLRESIQKTRQALEIAYSGFDNAVEVDMIDSYIYEINALQKRYRHLTELAAKEYAETSAESYTDSPVSPLVSHVLG